VPLVITDEFGRSSYIISVQRLHYFFPAGEPDKRLSSRESADILERLLHITLEEPHVFRHKWQANDFVVWSNRRIIHTATANSAFSGQPRLFHLVFLDSNRPTIAARDN